MFRRSRQARIRQGLHSRWLLFHPRFDGAAWSGTHWVEVNPDGFPIGSAKVCVFDNEDLAMRYALEHDFDTVTVDLNPVV
jgi:hypothetical protein